MAMSLVVDEVPPGAARVSIMEMVDPGRFWVTEPPGNDMTLDRQNLIALEEIMFKHFRRSAYYRNTHSYLPEEGELVAVKNIKTQRWHRGEIVGILNTAKGYLYKVFLIDYGLHLKVHSIEIRELPPSMNQLKPQAFQVGLYALIPTTIDMDYNEKRMKRVVCTDWTIAAATFVKDILKEANSAYLVQKFVKQIVYAEVYLYLHERYINLGEELCEKEFAVWDEDTFLDILKEEEISDEVDISLLKLSSVSMITPSSSMNHISECVNKRENNPASFLRELEKWRTESMEAMEQEKKETCSEEQDSLKVVKNERANEIEKPNRFSRLLALVEAQNKKRTMEEGLSDVCVTKTGSTIGSEPDQRLMYDGGSLPKSSNARVLVDKNIDKSLTLDNSNCVFIPAGAIVNAAFQQRTNSSAESIGYSSSKSNGHTGSPKGHNVIKHQQDSTLQTLTRPTLPSPRSSNTPLKKSSSRNRHQLKKNYCKNVTPIGATKLESDQRNNETCPSPKSCSVRGLADEIKMNVDSTPALNTSDVFLPAEANLSDKLPLKNNFCSRNNVYLPINSLPCIGGQGKVCLGENNNVETCADTLSGKATSPASPYLISVKPETDRHVDAPNKDSHKNSLSAPKCINLLELLKQQALKKNNVLIGQNLSQVTKNIEDASSGKSSPSSAMDSSNIELSQNSLSDSEPSLLDKLLKLQAQKRAGIATTTKARLPNCAQHSSTLSVASSSSSSSSSSSLLSPSQQSCNLTKLNRYKPEPKDLPPIENNSLHPKLHTIGMPQHHQMDSILVHGEYRHCKPLMSRTQAGFAKEIHQALDRLGFHDPTQIQKFVWPALLRGHNLIMVSPSHSGKTLAYAAPLVGFLFQHGMYTNLPRGNGPVTLILCSGSNSAQHVYHTCHELMRGHDKLSVLVTYGGGAEMEAMVPLINGCDILISTPRCYLRLLRHSRLITNLKRLSHLVLDEADNLTLKFLPEVKTILSEVFTALKKRNTPDSSIQFITASVKWCPALESFARNIPRPPAVCITSHLEAAVYARLKPVLHFVEPHNRIDTVCGILEKQQGMFKTVVVCQLACEVEELATAVSQSYQQVLVAHEGMLHFTINDVHEHWISMSVPGRYPVLICSDVVLCELKIQDAMRLVHYSLPSVSKSMFAFRFSCLVNNYKDLLEPICEEDMLTPECMVHILIDEDNIQQLPLIVQLMKRLGATILPSLEAATAEAVCKKELKKGDVPLCYSLKAFGDCWDKSVCPNRHIIRKAFDTPTSIPMSGTVKIKILSIHDACNFSARLLEHTSLEGEIIPLPDQYIVISLAINSHFRNPKNRVAHGIPKLNDICAIQTKLNVYQRARVVAITRTDSSDNAEVVQVHYLDEGNIDEVKVIRLIALPADLQTPPPQVVEVFLCRLAPCDLDWRWSRAASLKVYDWLEETRLGESQGMFMVGKIALSIGNSIWLDPLECHQNLPAVNTTVVVLSLRRKLLEAKLAVENLHHLDLLRALCNDAGVELPLTTPADVVLLLLIASFLKDAYVTITQREQVVTRQACSTVLPRPSTLALMKTVAHHQCETIVVFGFLINTRDNCLSFTFENLRIYTVIFYNIEESSPPPADLQSKPQMPVEVQWAFLDVEDWHLVTFIIGNSPAQFYVRPFKFEVLLNTLLKELQNVAEEKKVHDEVLEQGSYCLGQFPDDGMWYRAKVQSIENEKLRLFFVDHGDHAVVNRTEALPIAEKWLTKLPFQAVECCLAGVEPTNSDTWSEEATDALFEMTAEENNGPVKLLYLKVCEKMKPAAFTGGYLYRVALIETTTDKDVVLNRVLAERGLAVLVESESHFLEISSIQLKENQNWDDGNANLEDEDGVPKAIDDCDVKELILPEANCLQLSNLNTTRQDFDTDKFLEFANTVDSEELMEFVNSTLRQAKQVCINENDVTTSSIHSLSSDDAFGGSKEVDVPYLGQSDCSRSSTAMSNSSRKSVRKTKHLKKRATKHKTEDVIDVNGVPPLISNTRTPEVMWRQDSYRLWLKINIVDVEQYFLSWTINSLEFSTEVNGSVYHLDMTLFGSMNPFYLEHSAKGLQVVIKLFKALEGYEWPRLLKQEGRWTWLKYDFEGGCYNTDPYEGFRVAETDDITQNEVERSELKEGKIVADFMVVDPDHDNDSGSDVFVPDDDTFDPYDPLS